MNKGCYWLTTLDKNCHKDEMEGFVGTVVYFYGGKDGRYSNLYIPCLSELVMTHETLYKSASNVYNQDSRIQEEYCDDHQM